MICRYIVTAAMLTGGLLTLSEPAAAQRQQAQPAPEQTLPLCRQAEPGERCRTRNGTVLIRRDPRPGTGRDTGQTQNLGGGDPGWEVGDPRPGAGREDGQTQNLGGGDPGWEIDNPRPGAGRDDGQTNNLGGGDPGWEVRDETGIKSPGDGPESDQEQ
ncbi:hypothetical protein [Maricaulis sp.]|uniref:hypothetical protein n=1 Tax=Maricaulis sp. TaxID=1486257 RepID=UPI003A90CA17